ncbi:hypothetical protein OV208_35570 [Corallococcus sp. bb12-1]|uniref:hypothetical protein n=1 Tax=Corallococcus sp. bb12-1 TaxID=2996784 RepID=UPI00226E6473|nr:hypothetical protein [Corallococcus sp. bb12-1]MCY1046678.1 hypothetical protein [Corallococcus sp. bb12-1]
MTRLTPEDGDLLVRYGHLYDDVIHSVRMDFSDQTRPVSSAEVVIYGRKGENGPEWIYLRFRFIEVKAFQFVDGNISYQVLSDGGRIRWKDGLVTLDLDPGPDGIDNPDPDYVSSFFITAKACEWEEEAIP